MKTKLLLFFAAVLAAPFAPAQITLQNFSAFASPNTYFTGDWEFAGDLGGTHAPRGSFSQGAGFYNFAGGSNRDTAAAIYFFDAPLNITGYSLLQTSARLIAGNAAPTVTITLFDSLGESAFAVLPTAALAGANFTTLSTALTYSAGFNPADLSSFQLSGNVVNGAQILSFSLDTLAVATASSITPVPEPGTYGALGGIFLALIVLARKTRRRVTSQAFSR